MSDTLADSKTTTAGPTDGLAVLEQTRSAAETYGIPLAVLLEITHRCPLQCPYCSNPVELDRGSTELTTEEWKKVLSELAELGVLQVHFSGGEPTARKDIVELVQHANDVGLYTNLITSAVLLALRPVLERVLEETSFRASDLSGQTIAFDGEPWKRSAIAPRRLRSPGTAIASAGTSRSSGAGVS